MAFKFRMENEKDFLIELTGKFQSQSSRPPRKSAAELIDFKPQRINELVKKEKLHGVKIGSVQYVSKDEFIEYVSSPEMVVKIKTENNKLDIINF